MRVRGRPHRTLVGLIKAFGLYPKDNGVFYNVGGFLQLTGNLCLSLLKGESLKSFMEVLYS